MPREVERTLEGNAPGAQHHRNAETPPPLSSPVAAADHRHSCTGRAFTGHFSTRHVSESFALPPEPDGGRVARSDPACLRPDGEPAEAANGLTL